MTSDGMGRARAVLLIAYHYPPEGSSSGVLRTLAFSRYLPAHGWTPHVLTVRESLYRVRDDDLLARVPPVVAVHRARAWDTVRHFSIRGRYLEWMAVPDRVVSWLPFGLARGLAVIRRAGVRVLVSTSPQPTAHLIAALLKRRTGLPWVADFRDPWIEEGIHPRPGSLRFRLESWLERRVVEGADCITVTTPELRDDFLQRYPRLPEEKVVVIWNGYDEEDFATIGAVAAPTRFEMLHAGMVTPDYRDPMPVLRAVASLIADGRLSRDEARVVFLGGGPYVESTGFRQAVGELGLTGVVEVLARISHRATLRRLHGAAVLVLLQASDDTRSMIPAKAFEYLRTGRPIFALTPLDSATWKLLREVGVGRMVAPSCTEAVRSAVGDLHARWRHEPDRMVTPRDLERFSRRALTGRLADVLGRLTGPKGRAATSTAALEPEGVMGGGA